MGNELRIIWLLAIGLGLACIFGYLAQKAKQSPILGYLFAGYLMGPNSPGFVADLYISEQLASIGITLLMFAVGLSFNWKDLIAVKKIALPGALLLSILSISAGTFYTVYLGESLIAGFVVGLAICVSSTVVIVRVLSDQGILHSKQGHIIVGWTIVEDLISVVGLLLLPALVPSLSGGQSFIEVVSQISWVFFKIAMLGLFVYFIGDRLIEAALRSIARTRSHELFTLAILTCIFLIALGSSYLFGVSLALGAFIAGTIVGKTDMSHQAAANALPMRDAFAVIFFLSVGMLFSPLAVMKNLPLFFGILTILLLLRPLVAFLIVKLAKYPLQIAFSVALAIAQIGEYSFILAEEGSQLRILPDNAYDIIVASAFITIGLNPILFQLLGRFIKFKNTGGSRRLSKQSSFLPRVVVIGFGPVGKEVTRQLLNKGFHVTVIDQNVDTVSAFKGELEAIFGDATQTHILQQAQIERAKSLIITAPDAAIAQAIISNAQQLNPSIKILARTRFSSDLNDQFLENVSIICDEELSLHQFSREILKHR